MLKIYTYSRCDTCRKALKFLRDRKVEFQEIPIRENPPSLSDLKTMAVAYGNVRKLFNTSGADYKALKLGIKLSTMSEEEALSQLANNGNLIKRPFLIGSSARLVGFSPAEWQSAFSDSSRYAGEAGP
jgi:arsenate reductase (glutaredoxin)